MDNKLSEVPMHHARGVGPKRAELLAGIGIATVKDSLYYLPYRYEDRSSVNNIASVREGLSATVRGRVIKAAVKGPPSRRLAIFESIINDGTAIIAARWFNRPFMKKNISAGQEIFLSGMVKKDHFSGTLYFDNPEYEIVGDAGDSLVHAGRIVPVYRLTEGISQKQFRKIMFEVVEDFSDYIADPIPAEIIKKHNLPSLRESIKELHFPSDGGNPDVLNRQESIYHRRLIFDELFSFAVDMAVMKKSKRQEKVRALSCEGVFQRKLMERLPFALTADQRTALAQIKNDMAKTYPMKRLLQGDVGCGKTIVAFMAMLHAVECGCQAALMAPTEVLAEQHFYTLGNLTENLGIKVILVTGRSYERDIDVIASKEAAIVVGTHALIQEGVVFGDLGLVVIDEQHKFGVVQRGLLEKKGTSPHVIVMTATPIPRSLALTLYGDLDYSVIKEMPSGRMPVVTRVLIPGQKAEIYSIMKEEIRKGRQAYVVYPVVGETEDADLKSAVQGCEAFRMILPEFRVALLHGRMDTADKQAVMMSFKRGDTDILVSTTVIEVGVDVPNATVMVIVHAERFGLAQLHQLRGRVGRGGELSYCLLIEYGPLGGDARRRLDVMAKTSDGFKIAEEDLDIRGPGQFFGTRQAGMPDFKVADPGRDLAILEIVRKEASDMVENRGRNDSSSLLGASFGNFLPGKTYSHQKA